MLTLPHAPLRAPARHSTACRRAPDALSRGETACEHIPPCRSLARRRALAPLPQLPRLLFQYAIAHCGQLCQCRMPRAIRNRGPERPGPVDPLSNQPPQVRMAHRLRISSNRDAHSFSSASAT